LLSIINEFKHFPYSFVLYRPVQTGLAIVMYFSRYLRLSLVV
jgi:hypothetical protein